MENNTENEISLVEMLATVIRHRTWVYVSIALGVLLSFLLVIVLPWAGVNVVSTKTVTLETVVRTVPIPGDAKESVNFDIPGLFQSYTRNLALAGAAYRESLMSENEAVLTSTEFNGVVKHLLSKGLSVTMDEKSLSFTLTLTVGEQNEANGVKFLTLLTENIRNSVRDYVVPLVNAAIDNLSSGRTVNGELGEQTLAQFEQRAKALRGVLADPGFPLAAVGRVESIQDESGLSKGFLALLIILGFMFIGVILTFLVEAIRRTQQDPAKAELLKQAWNRR